MKANHYLNVVVSDLVLSRSILLNVTALSEETLTLYLVQKSEIRQLTNFMLKESCREYPHCMLLSDLVQNKLCMLEIFII